MGIATDISQDWHAALAALAWQVDLGVSEVVQEAPQNAFDLPADPPWRANRAAAETKARAPAEPAPAAQDPVLAAQALAQACDDLASLRTALEAFDLCELKRGARSTVFADGNPAARVLILGEPPGVEEDRAGRPFVGAEGGLLDLMFASIGLSRTSADRASALYLTSVLPWRPPGNRAAMAEEIALLRPFVERHIALANPDIIVALGNTALEALTGQRGILAARGTWAEAYGKPVLPMAHPAYLIKHPAAKREAWADLLHLKARLT
jgi:uracil-DNA glycosylase family 4